MLSSINVYASTYADKIVAINIQQQKLASALTQLSEQADVQVFFPFNLTQGKTANAVKGEFTALQALKKMLQGTGLYGGLSTQGVLMISNVESFSAVEQTEGDVSMYSKKKMLASLVGFFVGSGVAGNGVAATSEEIEEKNVYGMDEIVVTAQKREERLIDVPISITALTGDAINDAGIQNITDLSYAVPNLSVWEKGPGAQTVTIRGVGNVRGSSSLVGIYFDEIPVSLIPDRQLDLQAIDIERVEVLRGPQGTLYGQGSVGGAVRFITNSPSFDGVSGNVSLSVIDVDKGDLNKEFTGVANLPVIDDVLAFRVAASYKNKGGWIDQPATGKENINDQELANIRLAGLWQIADNASAKASVIHHRNSGGGYNYANVGEVSDSNYRSAVDRTVTPSFSDDYDIYNLTLNYDLDYMEITSISSYIDIDKQYKGDSQFSNTPSISDESLTELLGRRLQQIATVYSQEIRLSSSEESSRFDWTAGVFYSDVDREQRIPEGVDFGLDGMLAANFPVATEHRNSESFAYFGDISYEVTDRLTVGFGTRYFEDQRDVEIGIKFPQENFYNLSSRVYASFELSDDASVYSSISEGFRSGGVNPPPIQMFEPEEIINYEIGVKAMLLDRRVSTDLALFYSEYSDYQTTAQDLSLTAVTFGTLNAGTAEIKGVEWNVQWAVTQNLSLGFSGNITDAEVTEVDVEPAAKFVGDPMDFVPENSYSFNANYVFDWSASVSGFVRLDYNRQGKTEYADRLAGFSPDTEVTASQSFDLIHLNIGAQWERVEATLFGRNLSNEDQLLSPSPTGQAPQAQPRSFGIQLGYQF